MGAQVRPSHLERDAYVSGRQSTGHHVRSQPESQRRQYALANHARGLGFAQVVVIDEAMGRSGPGRQERPGPASSSQRYVRAGSARSSP